MKKSDTFFLNVCQTVFLQTNIKMIAFTSENVRQKKCLTTGWKDIGMKKWNLRQKLNSLLI